MIPRSAARNVLRAQKSSLAATSHLPVRNLSSALTRSSLATSRTPRATSLASAGPSLSTRQFSWTPWKQDAPRTAPTDAAETDAITQATAATPQPTETISTTSATPVDAPLQAPVDSIPSAPAPFVEPSAPVDLASSSADAMAQAGSNLFVPPGATLGDLVKQNPDIPLKDILTSPEALDVACTVSDLKSIGLSHGLFSFPGWAADGIVALHSLTGLPWWGTIVAITCLIRLCIVRPVISAQKHNIRLQAVQPQMAALMERMKDAQARNDQVEVQVITQTLQKVFAENDVHPFRSLKIPLMQLPIFLSMFYGLNRLATTPIPGLTTGGLSWIPDLTQTDPYWILPISSMILTNIVIRVGADGTKVAANGSSGQKHVLNILPIFSLIFVPVAAQYPAAMCLYWTTTNVFTLIQAFLLSRPSVKRILGIPIPKAIAPPPGSVPPDPSPKDTFFWLRDKLRGAYDQAGERAAEQQQAQRARAVRNGRRRGMEGMTRETIRERRS